MTEAQSLQIYQVECSVHAHGDILTCMIIVMMVPEVFLIPDLHTAQHVLY